ncbi:tail fiber domain-containing protein [Sulfurovum sp. CS9]|uniref:tail fiber domain-containing protein n=1 Tax=Sulfurovum sp. CS9 TaxID=3391146 RepID=UPI0039ECBA99
MKRITKSVIAAAAVSLAIVSQVGAADQIIDGVLTVNTPKASTDPIGTDEYESILLKADDISAATLQWSLGVYNNSTYGIKGFSITNQDDIGPFFIDNSATDVLLGLMGPTVAVNPGNDPSKLALIGQANLIVFGDMLATWSGSNTVGDGLKNLITLSATNSDVGGSISSDAGFRLVNGSTSKGWNFRTNSGGDAFQATLQGTGGSEFTISNATANISGTELYLGNGAKNVGGVWINASSRALKENIKELNTQDALAAFHKLQPVTYNYKSDKKEQVVGFIAEDVPELVAIQSRDGLSSMDMVAVLTKVVQEQDKMLQVQAEKIAKLETMQKRLAKVESLLTNLALDTSKTTKEKISLK